MGMNQRHSSKSSTKQRLKVEKQIAKANRKHAKHNPLARTKLKKDPGVPSKFPFKDKALREIEKSRQTLETERGRQRHLHLQSQGRSAEDTMEVDNSIAGLAQTAEERDLEYEAGVMAVDVEDDQVESSAKQDTSRKAYTKEFKKIIEQADVILYILDARDPEGTRSREIERSIREFPNGQKQLVLILNKIDLVPPETVARWMTYLCQFGPVLPFHSSSNPQFNHPSLPPKKLTLLLHNALKSRRAQLKYTLAVGVIGFPNTGKSSIINALTKRLGQGEKVTTGAEAGLTKESRQVKLDGTITLIDSPGIVFPSTESSNEVSLILLNVLPSSSILDVRPPIKEILLRLSAVGLLADVCTFYGIVEVIVSEYTDSTSEFLLQVARKRGRLGRGGIPSLDSAGKIVLNDWTAGKIKWWTEPPVNTSSVTDEKVIVSEWAEAFDIDALLKDTDVEMKE